jgi:hypothetical protein
MSNNLTRLSIQVTTQQKQYLQQLSQHQHIPISSLIRMMLNRELGIAPPS